MKTQSMTTSLGTQTPVKGRRVFIDRFELEESLQLREEIVAMGLSVTSLRSKADLIVVPDSHLAANVEQRNQKMIGIHRLRQLMGLGSNETQAPLKLEEARPVIENMDGSVRILDVFLERSSKASNRVPPSKRFDRVCLDHAFLEAAAEIARAVEFRMPCVLEGETAAAKTTAILWVAHQLNQPVVRLNLNGQTDTGELIGRYVPDARQDSRSGWRFQEGMIPQAMREGWWVILDEMNLAEPQVLERLNPVLEEPAGLVLSEGDGTVFGDGGDVSIHPSFRMFATLNPAEYAGRSTLSPAYRDRWTSWNWMPLPDEEALIQTLNYWAFGEHPVVALGSGVWQGSARTPVLPDLGADPRSRELLARVARFHAAISKACQPQGTIGRNRREPFVFTRRTLWTTLVQVDALVREKGANLSECLAQALRRTYGQRLREISEREALSQALIATGIV